MDKVQLLVQSYQTLKENKVDYDSDYLGPIRKVLKKIFKYDFDLGVKLWIDMLETEGKTYENSSSYDDISSDVASDIDGLREDDYQSVVQILKANPVAMDSVFKYTSDADWPSEYLVWQTIVNKDFTFSYQAAKLISENKNDPGQITSLIVSWADNLDSGYKIQNESDKPAIGEFLMSLGEFVTDKPSQAQIVAALVDYL